MISEQFEVRYTLDEILNQYRNNFFEEIKSKTKPQVTDKDILLLLWVSLRENKRTADDLQSFVIDNLNCLNLATKQ